MHTITTSLKKKAYNDAYRDAHRSESREYFRQRRRALKKETLAHYGLVCAHCGFSDIRALQIDHMNDDGAEERRKLGGKNFSGWRFYEWLKANNWPDGYQTLCANCNMIKHFGEAF